MLFKVLIFSKLVVLWFKFSCTRRDSTFSRYSPGFYHFSVLTQIRPFSGTRRESFSILARILPFPGPRPYSTIFRYSHRFDLFSVLHLEGFSIFARILIFRDTRPDSCNFQYSHRFDPFPVLTRILQFFGTHTDSTLFHYSPEQLFDTRTNSAFSGTRLECF